MKNNILVGVIVGILVLVGAYAVLPREVKTVVKETVLGASPGPDLNSSYWAVNGVVQDYRSPSFNTGTSTLCVVAKPSATSTLTSFTAFPNAATSTTVLLILQERSNAFAPIRTAATSTTDFITSYVLPANSRNLFSTTTELDTQVTLSGPNRILKPGGYLVFWAKAGGTGSIPTDMGTESNVFSSGLCKVEFKSI